MKPEITGAGHAKELGEKGCGRFSQPLSRPQRTKQAVLMQNVVLIVHLLLALVLIGVVLMQRSEGGGLGIGGGDSNPQAGRPPLTAMAKLTWGLAVAFIATSLTLTVLAAQQSATTSVLDRLGIPTAPSSPERPALPTGDTLLPPPVSDDTLAPPPID